MLRKEGRGVWGVGGWGGGGGGGGGGVTKFSDYVKWVCQFTDWAGVCDICVYIEVVFLSYVYALKYFCGFYERKTYNWSLSKTHKSH